MWRWRTCFTSSCEGDRPPGDNGEERACRREGTSEGDPSRGKWVRQTLGRITTDGLPKCGQSTRNVLHA